MMKMISSQRYRDEKIVEEKRASRDYTVSVVTVDALGVSVIIDGHHSLSAALYDGVEPQLVECTCSEMLPCDSDIESWLASHWIDSDWHDPITGELFF